MDEKKPIEEYINLSIMNLTKAVDKMSGEMAVISDKLTAMNEHLLHINWNLGKLTQKTPEEKK